MYNRFLNDTRNIDLNTLGYRPKANLQNTRYRIFRNLASIDRRQQRWSREEAIDYIRQRTMLNLTTTQMYFTREFAKRFIIREEDSGKRYYGVDRRQGSQGKLVVTDSTPQPQKAN